MDIDEIAGLKAGGIYVLRCRHQIRREDMERVAAKLKLDADRVGCQFILLDASMELVGGKTSGAEDLLKHLAESREFGLYIGCYSEYGASVLRWLWDQGIEPKAAHLPPKP